MTSAKQIKNISVYALLFWGVFALISLAVGTTMALDHSAKTLNGRTIESDDLGIMNPAGLAFSPAADILFVIDGRPSKPTRIDMTKVSMITPLEDPAGYLEVPIAITNPANMAYDARTNHLFFYEPGTNELIGIPVNADGFPDSGALIRIKAHNLEIQNPQGMTFDPINGILFILDSAAGRIIRIEPGPQDSFDNTAVFENSSTSYIDLAQIGSVKLQGIAFNAANGHLYLLSPIDQILYELSDTGQVISTYDLSSFDLINPQSMVLAPSADPTDDPLEISLYIADIAIVAQQGRDKRQQNGKIVELSFVEPVVSALEIPSPDAALTACLIRTIDTSLFDPPSPDPAGLAYLSDIDRLLISDSEINEYNPYEGANLFEIPVDWMPSDPDPIPTGDTTPFSDEPTGVAFNPNNGHLYFSDDTGRRVYDLDPGSDGQVGTGDDAVTSFQPAFSDPEGIAYGRINNEDYLFVAHGAPAEVAKYTLSGSLVSSFDVYQYGVSDPEGIEFNSESGTLFVLDSAGVGEIVETNIEGTLIINTIDIRAADAVKPAGITFAPGSLNPGVMNIYIVDRNSDGASPVDGKLYEMSLQCGDLLPVAVDDAFNINADTVLIGNVLVDNGNGADALGNEPSTVSLVADVSSGTLNLNPDGSFTYQPNVDFSGIESFTYRITDVDNDTSDALVMVTVECTGNFDGDNDVDDADLVIFLVDFGRTDCVGDCDGDFDLDGDVDGSDLVVFIANFGRTDCP